MNGVIQACAAGSGSWSASTALRRGNRYKRIGKWACAPRGPCSCRGPQKSPQSKEAKISRFSWMYEKNGSSGRTRINWADPPGRGFPDWKRWRAIL